MRYNRVLAILSMGLIGYGILAFYNPVKASGDDFERILFSTGISTGCFSIGLQTPTIDDCISQTVTNYVQTDAALLGSAIALPLMTEDPERFCVSIPYTSLSSNVSIRFYIGSDPLAYLNQYQYGSITFSAPFIAGIQCKTIPASWTAAFLQGKEIWTRRTATAGTSNTKFYVATGQSTMSYSFRSGYVPLSIIRPILNQKSTIPLYANGECNDSTVHIMVSDQQTYASSSVSSFADVTCSSSDLWNIEIYTASAGGARRFLTATDTDEFVQTSWFPMSQSEITNDLLGQATSTELLDWFSGFQLSKPFSYVTDIYEAIDLALNYTYSTSSYSLPVASFTGNATNSPYFHPTISLFDATTLTNILTVNQWAAIRTLFNTVLYLSFAFYLWKRLSNFI